MNPHNPLSRAISFALLVSICSALVFGSGATAQARTTTTPSPTTSTATPIDKVSPDLRELIRSGRGADQVKLIVQRKPTSPQSGGLIGGLLGTVVGLVGTLLSSLNINLITAPANSVDAMSQDPDVTYISLDTEIRTFGHVTTTTGADQTRAQKTALGANYMLDGSGVRIAILDSGIDVNHKSFTSQSGKVVLSKDFTGENRTDDPYGHGTHVAAVAAGVGTPSGGKYEGVAPGANLLNLRVMNAKGIGSVSTVLKALDWVYANRTKYNIRVVNMSLGGPAINSYKNDPLCNAVRRLSNAGVVVVAAAGNEGKTPDGQKGLRWHSHAR